MDSHQQLEALLDLAEQVGMDVRPLAGSGGGGEHPGGALVRIRGKEVLFLDAAATVADQLAVTAAALAGRAELEDRFLPPELRQLIENRPDKGQRP